QITDGSSNTYLIGEKFLRPLHFESGNDTGDNETWCTGFNNDNYRMAFDPPALDVDAPDHICQRQIFGSSHPAGWFMSWCDGQVTMLAYDIDITVHRANANRADEGQPLEPIAPYAPMPATSCP